MSAATAHGRGSTCRFAAAPGRLSLAAALAAALLLSPGVRDACAGCCRDEAPAVAAPLAAGVAPVHCCHSTPAPAPVCCGPADEPATCGVGTALPTPAAADRSDCRCHLGSHDGLPAEPSRQGLGKRSLDDSAPLFAAADVLPLRTGAGEPSRALVAGAVPRRPVRILYGVWRN